MKIHFKLAKPGPLETESMWAKNLGDGNYQIENIPFYALGLNLNDIVFAEAPSDGDKPIFKKLIKSNGHRTIRFNFTDSGTKEEYFELINAIKTEYIIFERNDLSLYVLDVAPAGDYNMLLDAVKELEKKMILKIEGVDGRNDGGFDRPLQATIRVPMPAK